MTTMKTGWEVKTAAVSRQNGGLFITGVNHDSLDPLGKQFFWHIRESVTDSRYDWSGCEYDFGAEKVLEQLRNFT